MSGMPEPASGADWQHIAQALHDARCDVCGEHATTIRIDPGTKQLMEGSGRCKRCLHNQIGKLLGLQ